MRFFAAFAVALGLFLSPALAQEGEAEPMDQPVVAAMFYSAFCATCLVLDPRINAVRGEFEDRPITFITFNKSLSAFGGAEKRAALAAEHGIEALWEQYKKAQGFMLLADPESGALLSVVQVRHSEDDIRALINAALTRPAPAA